MYNNNEAGNVTENIIEVEETTKQTNQSQKSKNIFKRKTVQLVGGALVFGMVSGAMFQGVQYASTISSETKIEENQAADANGKDGEDSTKTATSTSTTSVEGKISEVVENVMPSIVAIDCTLTGAGQGLFGQAYGQEQTGSGSGIIIGQNNKELLIVTNNHVIEGDNAKVVVTFQDETTAQATVKGADSSADLAVLSIDLTTLSEDTKNKIKIATLGNSEETKVGSVAIAIGNALGYGQSVTVGYISAKDRAVAMEDASMKLLQTDAAINPGNSGGALLNAAGEVIGINSVKYASEDVEGMGYAIPISAAIPIMDELMNREQLDVSEQAYLGVIGEEVTESYSQRFNMPAGIYIGQISKGSPAQKAGLVEGNIIVGFNGRTIASVEDLQEILTYTKAGTTVTITIKELEDGEYVEKEVSVTLGSKREVSQSTKKDMKEE